MELGADSPSFREGGWMTESSLVIGTSFESFSDAAAAAFRDVPGDPDREGAAAARVERLWVTKGGIVGRVQYHVELSPFTDAGRHE